MYVPWPSLLHCYLDVYEGKGKNVQAGYFENGPFFQGANPIASWVAALMKGGTVFSN